MCKQINNLAELQDFVEEEMLHTILGNKKCTYISIEECLGHIKIDCWENQPEYVTDSKVWLRGKLIDGKYLNIPEEVKLNFECDFSECVFEVICHEFEG